MRFAQPFRCCSPMNSAEPWRGENIVRASENDALADSRLRESCGRHYDRAYILNGNVLRVNWFWTNALILGKCRAFFQCSELFVWKQFEKPVTLTNIHKERFLLIKRNDFFSQVEHICRTHPQRDTAGRTAIGRITQKNRWRRATSFENPLEAECISDVVVQPNWQKAWWIAGKTCRWRRCWQNLSGNNFGHDHTISAVIGLLESAEEACAGLWYTDKSHERNKENRNEAHVWLMS